MTVLEVIQRSSEFLGRKGVESPRLQVELLLAHVLGMPRLELYLNFERTLSDAELETLRELVMRRGRREPVQYLVGTAAFFGRDFKVSPATLIPRPETEGLVERAVLWARSTPREKLTILDYGTGSGCLAVTLAAELPTCAVWGLDACGEALEIAASNAATHEVAQRIRFIEGEGLGALPDALVFDLVVANPPYIPSAEIATLEPEVRDYEPRLALDGGPDGLRFARELAGGIRRISDQGCLCLEFSDGQESDVAGIFEAEGWIVDAVEPDLSGTPRILVARPRAS